MATFTNQATLSYNGITTNSNIVTGEIVEVLSATKTAISTEYESGDRVTYAISLINSGTTALTGLTLTDNLGAYTLGTLTLTPLNYVQDSILYYVNGVLQATPTVTDDLPLTITGITVPANGNALIIYQVETNEFSPLATGSTVTNIATISGAGLTEDVVATETITVVNEAELSITKALTPVTVQENGQITYTFVIENRGNTAATAADLVSVTDTFNPILSDITVTYNGAVWTEGENYTYNEATGVFTTTPGDITVPAATYSQNIATGAYAITPGVSVLTVTGTV